VTVEASRWPIVVGGCHRSGTSLTRRILDAHPRIHCGPEVPFFRDFYGDYREDALEHLRFSTTVRSMLPEDELLDVLGHAFVEVHERAARSAGKARWADKAPENVLYLRQWQSLLGDDWYLVHVVRNPLDTVASMEGRFPLTLPPDLEGRISFYRRYTEAGLAFGDRHLSRYRLFVYEALCESPDSAIRELMTSLGEERDPRQLRFNESGHATGLEDPKVSGTTTVHADSIGRWRSVLTQAGAETVWDRTRDLWARIDPERCYSPDL
jgi:hypothetical protein